MRNNYQKIQKKKQRRLKKRHFIFIGLVAIFCDVLYSYTQNIKLILIISVILVALFLVTNLGTKIDNGKGFSSTNTGGNYY